MEIAADNPVGRGYDGHRKVEGPMDPGPPGGRVVRTGGAGLLVHHGYRTACAGLGGGHHECGVGPGGTGVAGGAVGVGRGAER